MQLDNRQKFILAVTILLLPLLACGFSSSHLDKARQAAEEGDTATAFEEYQLALDEDDLEPADQVAVYTERGNLYKDQEDWDEALADYEQALGVKNNEGSPAGDTTLLHGRQFDTLLERAAASRDAEEWETALADYESALAITTEQDGVGDANDVYTQRAELYVALQDWAGVVSDLDNVLEDTPNNYEALARRGYAHLRLRNFEQAIADLKASLQGNVEAASDDLDSKANLVNAYSDLGQAMLDLGEYDEALNSYGEALAIVEDETEQAEVLAARGFVYSEIHEHDKALADLNEALSIAPDMALAYAYRSYVYGDRNQYEEAIADATKAVELGTDLSDSRKATIIHARALAYLYTDQYELAVEDATESIRLAGPDNPNTARTYNIRSRANRLLGNYQQAIEDAGNAIELGTTDIVALSNFYRSRALAYFLVGENAAAMSDTEAAVEIEGGTPTASDLDLMGRIHYNLGEYEAALDSYSQAIELTPDDPWLHNGLGDIYFELEDAESAEASYRTAIKLDSGEALFHENLGFILRFTERYEDSVESYNTALKLDTDRPFSYIGRGIALANLGQYPKATTDLETALNYDLSPDIADFVQSILDDIN